MDMILKNTFQSISPAYELIGDVTVGTNTSQVNFNGLSIGKDDELLLVSDIYNATGTTVTILAFANGNNTESNYYTQVLTANNTSVTSSRVNYPAGFSVTNAPRTFCMSKIKLANSGYFLVQNDANRGYGGSSLFLANNYITSTFTASSITSLRLYVDNATSAIGVGSRFQLYKLVAEKVADIIVPSNTTSVDITGLNIGKDGEYYLSSYVTNGAGATSAFQFSVNDLAQTSFYYQQIDANATAVSAERANQARFSNMASSGACLTNSNIKLTNSGYGVIQANTSRYIGGSSIMLYKSYMATTSTLSAITKLTILATATNAIGANSRFTLYKMK